MSMFHVPRLYMYYRNLVQEIALYHIWSVKKTGKYSIAKAEANALKQLNIKANHTKANHTKAPALATENFLWNFGFF